MKTKLILLGLILMLSASCLCLVTPEPSEKLLEKYSSEELALGFLAVVVGLSLPLMAPVVLFKRLV